MTGSTVLVEPPSMDDSRRFLTPDGDVLGRARDYGEAARFLERMTAADGERPQVDWCGLSAGRWQPPRPPRIGFGWVAVEVNHLEVGPVGPAGGRIVSLDGRPSLTLFTKGEFDTFIGWVTPREYSAQERVRVGWTGGGPDVW